MSTEQMSFFKRSNSAGSTSTKTELRDLENNLLETWLLEHHKRQGSIISVEHADGKIGFCCIDLNQLIEIDRIQSTINTFHQENPNTPLIMLGTVQYPTSKFPAMSHLSQLPIQGISKHIVIANCDMNSDLFQQVEDIVQQQQLANKQRLSLWSEAKIKYTAGMSNLSQDKQQKLQDSLKLLEKSIVKGLDKEKSITEFIDNTRIILEEESHPFFNIVLKVAAVAIITLLAGAMGYGIGLTLCASYPSLFIVPFLGTAESTIPTLTASTAFHSCIGAGATCDTLFKPKEKMRIPQEVNELAESARSNLQPLMSNP